MKIENTWWPIFIGSFLADDVPRVHSVRLAGS
jgi:hypothetical protein